MVPGSPGLAPQVQVDTSVAWVSPAKCSSKDGRGLPSLGDGGFLPLPSRDGVPRAQRRRAPQPGELDLP